MPDPLIIIAGVFGFLCLLFLLGFIAAISNRKTMSAVRNFTFFLLMLVCSLLFGVISFSIQGYRALTHEEMAAYVSIESQGNKNFIAHFQFPDNSVAEYYLSGDELYVDAHILKWKSVANILGLHTLYELDRVTGRYSDIKEETSQERTVYELSSHKLIDIFKLRLEYEFLSFLVDAEYGSATFINVKNSAKFRLMVSTTGLLIRRIEE